MNRIQTSTTASRYAEFSSDVSIDNIAFGPNGIFALVRGFGTDAASQTLEIYDKSKTKVYNYPLRDYSQILSLDYYRFIDKKHVEHDAFVALLESFNNIIAIVYYIEGESNTHQLVSSDDKKGLIEKTVLPIPGPWIK